METLSGDDLDELVADRLQHTLEYAEEHSEYWSERFEQEYFNPEDVESPEDMLGLSPIGKDDLLENQPPESDDFRIPVLDNGKSYNAHCTSGTTGVEKWVFVNEDDEEISNESVRRGYAAAGIDGDSVLANFLPKGIYMSGKQSEDAANDYVKMHQAYGHTNTPPRNRVMSMFNDSNAAADSIIASPSSLERISGELEEYGVEPEELGIENIMVVGESSSEERRDAIAELYDSEVTNNYANTEAGFAAYQTTDCDVDAMHVVEDLRLVMVVNEEQNRLAEPGESGEVWVSTLYPEGLEGGMPIFNYRPGDVATYLGRRDCACDRTHKMIADVTRSDDAFEANQAKISPHQIEDVVHQEHYRDVLTGQYESELYLEDDDLDSMIIRVDAQHPSDIDLDTLEDRTPEQFFERDEEVALDYDAIEQHIEEEFLDAHVATKVFAEGGFLDVGVEVVDKGELNIYDQRGKPERIQVRE